MPPTKNDTLIIIPTYNELDNIEKIISAIEGTGGRFDILFVDDNSPDGTGGLIDRFVSEKHNLFVIHRAGKMGLGSAYIEGFRYGVKMGYEYIFEMDADLSHPPECLKQMLDKLNKFDIVVGSRFLSGSRNINNTPLRILISVIASSYMKLILGIGCSDPMGGFVGYRRKVLESLDYSNFAAKGYAFQAEIKYKSMTKGFMMTEIPIIFKNRDWGSSKISKKDVAEALIVPWKIRFSKQF